MGSDRIHFAFLSDLDWCKREVFVWSASYLTTHNDPACFA